MQEMSRKNKLFTDSVIRRMTRVSLACGAINLAQGFPDFDPPKALTDRLAEVSALGPHQYPITMGAPNFRQALARKAGRFMGRALDPDTDMVVTIGSTEAMVDTIFALTNPGDKIIMFSPYFENYRAQLCAILRASRYGNVGVMFPMVTGPDELHRLKQALADAEDVLIARGERFGPYRIGVMIETPAAVFMSGELAGEVDFFSIGTNDLTQYLLAMDRQNPNLAPFCDPHHPAILRAIRHTVECAHQARCSVGICGELAADEDLTEAFLRMGVDELSVAPARILPLRQKIRSLTLG